jgi:hypothetical protein
MPAGSSASNDVSLASPAEAIGRPVGKRAGPSINFSGTRPQTRLSALSGLLSPRNKKWPGRKRTWRPSCCSTAAADSRVCHRWVRSSVRARARRQVQHAGPAWRTLEPCFPVVRHQAACMSPFAARQAFRRPLCAKNNCRLHWLTSDLPGRDPISRRVALHALGRGLSRDNRCTDAVRRRIAHDSAARTLSYRRGSFPYSAGGGCRCPGIVAAPASQARAGPCHACLSGDRRLRCRRSLAIWPVPRPV